MSNVARRGTIAWLFNYQHTLSFPMIHPEMVWRWRKSVGEDQSKQQEGLLHVSSLDLTVSHLRTVHQLKSGKSQNKK